MLIWLLISVNICFLAVIKFKYFFIERQNCYFFFYFRLQYRSSEKMNVGVAHSDSNPTHFYFNSKGIWLTYLLLVFGVHLLLLSVPFFSVAVAWTLTNVLHDVVCIYEYYQLYVSRLKWLNSLVQKHCRTCTAS